MKRFFVLCLLPVLFLSACSSNKTSSDATEDTASKNDGAYSDYTPVVINSYLLGGVEEGHWINGDQLYPLMGDTEQFKVYVDGVYKADETGTKEENTDPDAFGDFVRLPTTAQSPDQRVLAVSSEKDIFVRPVVSKDPTDAAYADILAEFLQEEQFQAFTDPKLKIKQIYETDLDGDGTDEALISADNADETANAAFGSVVFLRKTIDGAPKNITLHNTLYASTEADAKQTAAYNELLDICDLNGDGTLEWIIKTYTNDFTFYGLYELSGNETHLLFINGSDSR